MVYIRGDIHGNIQELISDIEWHNLTKEDTIIICGDAGLIWYGNETDNPLNPLVSATNHNLKAENKSLEQLSTYSCTIAFIDGNHENHYRLNHSFPVVQWNGGKAHKISDNIYHLMRGEVFTIEGKTFLAMGGARSHDICDGILDPINDFELIQEYEKNPYRLFRVDRISWWKEEVPNDKERRNCYKNLSDYDFKVDYVLTHEMPASCISLLSEGYYKPDEYSYWLEDLRSKITYKNWFGGHYHIYKYLNDKDVILYKNVISV